MKSYIVVFILLLISNISFSQKDELAIGNQIWSTKNLDVIAFRNGDTIPHARTHMEWILAAKNQKPAWCWYENKDNHSETFGRLYNWFAVSDKRGLAPKGWHIPSKKEWDEMTLSLGGKSIAGLALKTRTGWVQNGNGTDIIGFHAFSGGNRFEDGHFEGASEFTCWWTSSEIDDEFAIDVNLSSHTYSVRNYHVSKSDGLYVRCIKDL